MARGAGGKKFVHGLCEWYTNPKTCWLGIFCAPCLACKTARKLGAGGGKAECRGWKYLVLSCLLPCYAMYKLRDKARRRTGDVNPDETCGDACRHCLAGIFCTACVNCQVRLDDQLLVREASFSISFDLSSFCNYASR